MLSGILLLICNNISFNIKILLPESSYSIVRNPNSVLSSWSVDSSSKRQDFMVSRKLFHLRTELGLWGKFVRVTF